MLSRSPAGLKADYESWLRWLESGFDAKVGNEEVAKLGHPWAEAIHLIYPMVRLVRPWKEYSKGTYRYRCVHFSRTRDGRGACGIYGIRPATCREYPWYEKSPHLSQKGLLYPHCAFHAEETVVIPQVVDAVIVEKKADSSEIRHC